MTPDRTLPHLADVTPSVLAAMGVPGFAERISLNSIPIDAEISGACVLLIDGLGAELLDTHADDAPVLASIQPDAAGRFPVDDGRRPGRNRHRLPVR